MPGARDRYYTSPPSIPSISMQYTWSPNAVATGVAGGNNVSGVWVPQLSDAGGALIVTTNNNSNVSGFPTQSGVFEMAGLAVVTSGFNPQYISGQKAPLAIDNINGGELVVASDLDQSVDSITSYVPSSTTVSNYTQSGNLATYPTISGNLLTSNPNRIQSYIQNVGSGILFVKLGSAPCTTGSYSFLLKPSTAIGSNVAADGGIWSDNGFWKGDVSVFGATVVMGWEA